MTAIPADNPSPSAGVGAAIPADIPAFAPSRFRALLIAAALAILCGALLLLTASAQAATQFGQTGSIPGFGFPLGGVAVDQASGDLYVLDTAAAVVDKYDASGTFISSFAGPGSGDGQLSQGSFNGPSGIAVDQATGDVYVTDNLANRVEKFDSSGNYLAQFNGADNPAFPAGFSTPTSVAVDPSSGDVYVVDSGDGVIERFDSAGAFLSQLDGSATPATAFSFPSGFQPPAGIAVDSTGRLYVVDTGNAVVDEFDSAGAYQGQLGVGTLAAPTELAIDAADDVYAIDSSTQSVLEFDSAGAQIPAGAFATNVVGGNRLRGIALGEGAAAVYVSATSFFSSQVLIFGAITLPDATTATPATALTGSTATVSGTVNPQGVALTECRFEYGLDTNYGQSAPCATVDGQPISSAAEIPADSSGHEVTANLTGLAPNSEYHYRLAAANLHGTTSGEDQTLTTLPVPTVDAESAADLAATSATLEAQVNPNGLQTTCLFEYGTTEGYGETVPCQVEPGSGATDATASAEVSSLDPNTPYHFRVLATNSAGTTPGADATFATTTTAPLTIPAAASHLTRTTAILAGSVDPRHSHTTYHFLYGPTAGYGHSVPVPEAEAGSGLGPQPASQPIGGLQAATVYHWALVATNVAGTTTSPDQTFTTAAGTPPLATTAAATAVGHTTATLGGSVDANGLQTSYELEIGTTIAYGTPIFGDAGSDPAPHAIALAVQGLAPGTTYHFRLSATNADGTSHGADATFTTPPYPQGTPPPPPTPIRVAQPPLKCKKGQVRKHGRCVKKPAKHHTNNRTANNSRGGSK